jgi:Holliday junction resolvasome RuvABC endonuclease subunit
MQTTHRQTVLAIDPGLRDLGYAVLRGRTLVDSGVRTFRLVPSNRRHAAILRRLRDWIERYRPTALVLEATPGNRHPTFRALRKLGRSIIRLARTSGIPFAVYPTQTVRKALVGNGWASKRDVAVALAAGYPSLRVYVAQNRQWKERYFQNMFDALALAVHHERRKR